MGGTGYTGEAASREEARVGNWSKLWGTEMLRDVEGAEVMKRLQHLACEGYVSRLGVFSLQEKRLRGPSRWEE